MLAVELRVLNVLQRPMADLRLLVRGEAPNDSSRRTEDERARWHFHADSHERVCADDAARADLRAVEDDRAHSDEHFIVDRAGVDDRAVTDRDAFADDR